MRHLGNSFILFGLALMSACMVGSVKGSDHADPIFNLRQESAITDLYLFPNEAEDKLIGILAIRRDLSPTRRVDIEPYRFQVHFDFDSAVVFDDEGMNRRYGGRIVKPKGIATQASITFRFNNDSELADMQTDGRFGNIPVRRLDKQLKHYETDDIGGNQKLLYVRSGRFDDPFIFPGFFGSNVIAVVFAIPMQEDYQTGSILAWATSDKRGKQIDHVGQALRSMLPRNDHINTLPPSEHVAAMHRYHDDPNLIEQSLQNLAGPLFQPKSFDEVPDVLILTMSREKGFPNGRWLTDDVVEKFAQVGDALFYDLSFARPEFNALAYRAEDEDSPKVNNDLNRLLKQRQAKIGVSSLPLRPTTNDKVFRQGFPYLAPAWNETELKDLTLPPQPHHPLKPEFTRSNLIVIGLIGMIGVAILLLIFAAGFVFGKRAGRKK